jgi:hypothetical protein
MAFHAAGEPIREPRGETVAAVYGSRIYPYWGGSGAHRAPLQFIDSRVS